VPACLPGRLYLYAPRGAMMGGGGALMLDQRMAAGDKALFGFGAGECFFGEGDLVNPAPAPATEEMTTTMSFPLDEMMVSDDDVDGIEELERRMWRDGVRLRRLKEEQQQQQSGHPFGGSGGAKHEASSSRQRQSQEQARRKKMSWTRARGCADSSRATAAPRR